MTSFKVALQKPGPSFDATGAPCPRCSPETSNRSAQAGRTGYAVYENLHKLLPVVFEADSNVFAEASP
jgi:hypothetical protein